MRTLPPCSALPDHVGIVIGLGSEPEMADFHTHGVVAGMQDMESIRGLTISQNPNHACSGLYPSLKVKVSPSFATGCLSNPGKAAFGRALIGFFQKSIDGRPRWTRTPIKFSRSSSARPFEVPVAHENDARRALTADYAAGAVRHGTLIMSVGCMP